MMKKWIILVIGVLLLGWGGFYSSGYWYSLRHPEIRNAPAVAEMSPSAPLSPGESVNVQTRFALPRFRKVLKAELTPDAAMTLAEEQHISCLKGYWSTRQWFVQIPLRAIRPGTVPAGTLEIFVSPKRGQSSPEKITLTVPQMTIQKGSVPENSAVELAPESIARKQPRYHRLWWGLLLLLIPLFGWIFRKKAHAAPPKTLKEKTLEALSALRGSLLKKEFSAESGIARLSDVIRNYLELRYKMPVSKKTTPEFLEELEQNNPLPAEDQPFLRDFLNSADLIKFAKVPCNETVVNAAIGSAEKLVEQTAEEETAKEVHCV